MRTSQLWRLMSKILRCILHCDHHITYGNNHSQEHIPNFPMITFKVPDFSRFLEVSVINKYIQEGHVTNTHRQLNVLTHCSCDRRNNYFTLIGKSLCIRHKETVNLITRFIQLREIFINTLLRFVTESATQWHLHETWQYCVHTYTHVSNYISSALEALHLCAI